jgi:PAS domain-containing protein
MALGENIKRERMIPIRNKIMYRNLEEELAEMKEKEFDFSETSFFSNDEIAVSLKKLNYFEEESQTKTSFQTEEHHPALDFILQSMLITADIGIDEKILTANSLFCRALNLENLEIGIRYFKEFILKEKLSDWALHWEKVQKGEPIQEIIELQPRNTEEKVILAATLYPVHQQGILQKVVLMAQDITKAISAYKNNTTIELDIDKNLKSAKIIVKI